MNKPLFSLSKMVQAISCQKIAVSRYIFNPKDSMYALLGKYDYLITKDPTTDLMKILWLTMDAYYLIENQFKIMARHLIVDASMKELKKRSYCYLKENNIPLMCEHVPFVFSRTKLDKVKNSIDGNIVFRLFASDITMYMDIYTRVTYVPSVPSDHICLRCKNRERRRVKRLCKICRRRRNGENIPCPFEHDNLVQSRVNFTCYCFPPLLNLDGPIFGVVFPVELYFLKYASQKNHLLYNN